MAKLAPRDERIRDLGEIRDFRFRLAALFDDPAIQAWFSALREGLLTDLLLASPTDDARRAARAAEVNILDKLRGYLETADADGQRAAEAIVKLERNAL